MFKYKNLTIIALCFLTTPALSENYKTKSVFKEDFKCISDEKGGFNHNATGHELTKFTGKEEFFLVHISNIPEKAILDMLTRETAQEINKKSGLSSQEAEDLKRNELEKEFLEKGGFSSVTTERGSYFIRTPRNNPNEASTYLYGNHCSAISTKNYASINCYRESFDKTFAFDLTTKRFTYSYAGTWNDKQDDGYHGDSSVFAFGKCEIYYR